MPSPDAATPTQLTDDLLDQVRLYNPSHAFGFFSTFNPDAIKDVTFYKGAYPAQYGGNLGESGSVSFMFERVGLIVYGADAASADDMFEVALEAGASDVESSDAGHEVMCKPDDFSAVRDALEARFGNAEDTRLDWKPQNPVAVDEDAAGILLKLLDALDDNDDVQGVAANFDVADDVLERLSA